MGLIRDSRRRVLVVTADENMAAMVRQALQATESFAWETWVTESDDALTLLRTNAVDAVVSDVSLPGTSGCSLIADFLIARPDMPLVVLTKRSDVTLALEAVRLGVGAYLTYDDGYPLLRDALDSVSRGGLCFSERVLETMVRELGRSRPFHTATRFSKTRAIIDSAAWEAAATLTDDQSLAELTPREAQIMSELARGLDNKTIGRHLGVSHGTVGIYVKRIRLKLGAATRNELMAISSRLGTPK